MAKKLRVLTPLTVDGMNLQYDDNDKVMHKETFVEVGAVKSFESLNASLPPRLRHKLEVGEFDDKGKFIPDSEKEPKNKKKKDETKPTEEGAEQ